MSDTARDKFLKYLRKQMKSGLTAGERVSAQKLYAEMMGETLSLPAQPVIDGKVDLPPLGEMNRTPTEFDETVRLAVLAHHDDGLGCLLHLLKPKYWMDGAWGESPLGWTNGRDNDRLLSWDDGRVLIADRINELGLDADKVYAHPQSHSSIAEFTAFINLPFAEQMERFK